MFRYLVRHKGFRTFSLEIAWSTGLRLNDYVLHGKGDPAQILLQEDQVWATTEYIDLLRWMRSYNLRHRDKVQFMGNDPAYVGREVFDPVLDYTGRHHPRLLAAYRSIFDRVDPETTDVEAWRDAYLERPLAERRALAGDARAAFLELSRHPRATEEYVWVRQHAKVIDQTLTLFAVDMSRPEQEVPKAMLHRDRAMAENTAWWHRRTGTKVLLSAHNGHVGYASDNPQFYPKIQGAFLRDLLGSRYVSAGFTFDHGSFNAQDEEERWKTFTLGPAEPGSNEHTLDRVRYRDFIVDTRRGPAKEWLMQSRPTRSFGLAYPDEVRSTALGVAYDLVIHLHRTTAAGLLRPAAGDWRHGA
jgi:erythromycin esterase